MIIIYLPSLCNKDANEKSLRQKCKVPLIFNGKRRFSLCLFIAWTRLIGCCCLGLLKTVFHCLPLNTFHNFCLNKGIIYIHSNNNEYKGMMLTLDSSMI